MLTCYINGPRERRSEAQREKGSQKMGVTKINSTVNGGGRRGENERKILKMEDVY